MNKQKKTNIANLAKMVIIYLQNVCCVCVLIFQQNGTRFFFRTIDSDFNWERERDMLSDESESVHAAVARLNFCMKWWNIYKNNGSING